MKGRRALAFVPDEAIEQSHEISGGAFNLYCFYCKLRGSRSGQCYPSSRESARALGSPSGHNRVLEWRNELVRKGWIRVEGHLIIPLLGFSPQSKLPRKIYPAPPPSDHTANGDIPSPPAPRKKKSSSGNKPSPAVVTNGHQQGGDIPSPAPLEGGDISGGQVVTFPGQGGDISGFAYKEEPAHEPAHVTSPVADSDETSSSAASSKRRQKNPAVEPWYGLFQQAYSEAIGGFPYEGQTKDFVQLRAMLNKPSVATWLTAERWGVGLRHYFQSELGSHTLADFATRFGDFYKNPLDRFGKPVKPSGQSQPETLRPLYVPDEPIADDDPNYVSVKEALSGNYKRPATAAK